MSLYSYRVNLFSETDPLPDSGVRRIGRRSATGRTMTGILTLQHEMTGRIATTLVNNIGCSIIEAAA
jgi:hypothetical protein